MKSNGLARKGLEWITVPVPEIRTKFLTNGLLLSYASEAYMYNGPSDDVGRPVVSNYCC
jgi:hypothetical protein